MSADQATIESAAPDAGERALIESIEDRRSNMIDRVRAWSRTNSGSRNPDGLEAMRAELEGAFAELGGEIDAVPLGRAELVRPDGAGEAEDFTPAFRLRQRPDAPVQLVLTGHHDTVFPADGAFQDWRMLDDDTINGPGVADMKGGLIVMCEALRVLERSPVRDRVGYTVLISPDEEIGSPGSRPLLMEAGGRAHAGMTYEPALPDGRLAGARKGSGNYSLVVRGRAAHAGREHHLGRNAIAAASRFAAAIDSLNGERDGVTFNIGRIDGGGALNVVPELAVVRFNVRMPDPAAMDWAAARVDACAAAVDAEEGISAALHGGVTRPPKPMAPPVAAMFDFTRRAGAALGLEIAWKDTGGVCEGNNLWAAGCPNVDTLGVRGGEIHSDQEFARLSSFVERAQLSALMLLKFASGAFDVRGLRESA